MLNMGEIVTALVATLKHMKIAQIFEYIHPNGVCAQLLYYLFYLVLTDVSHT